MIFLQFAFVSMTVPFLLVLQEQVNSNIWFIWVMIHLTALSSSHMQSLDFPTLQMNNAILY